MCQAFFWRTLYQLEKKIYISQVNHKAVNLTLDKHSNEIESNFINLGIASVDSCIMS